MKHKHYGPFWGLVLVALTALLFAPMSFAKESSCADKPTIKIGYVSWVEDVFEVKLAKKLIEDNYGCKAELQLSSVGVEYKALAGGSIDFMFEAWFPDNHRAYWDKVSTDVWDLGPLFVGAMNGWVVPDYIPESELGSIEDLHKKSVREKLDGKIHGIDPGAGIMKLSKKTMKAYDLDDYKLISSSGPAMTASLKRAIDKKEWVVVTLWTPHWAFGRWDLRFLKDPKKSMGKPQHSDKLVRKNFYRDYPQVTGMLSRLQIPLDMLQDALDGAKLGSYDEAVDKFIKDHPAMIHYWITGEFSKSDS